MKFIIQAGGHGSRMNNLTSIKPKCLIPVFGKPIICHWLDLHPDSEFIIICDYKKEILKKYLNKFSKSSNFIFVETNKKGTCAGIKKALNYINETEPFAIIWSDLLCLAKQEYAVNGINIGLTSNKCSFPCRWTYKNKLKKELTNSNGVSGIFVIEKKTLIQDIPIEDSFTKYLLTKEKNINTFYINDIIDIGTEEQFKKYHTNNRFFNSVVIEDNLVIKTTKIKKYESLIEDEILWYEHVKKLGFNRIPQLISTKPLTISKLDGVHPFDMAPSKDFLLDAINCIKTLHKLQIEKQNLSEMEAVYKDKTLERINSVKELIPFIDQEHIIINSVNFKNPFHEKNYNEFLNKIQNICNVNNFTLIHGDPTFSNMLSCKNKAYLIDPRGYFGNTKLIGDPRYDYAKFYYSFYSNYDSVNSKNYYIDLKSNCVFLKIKDNGWSILEDVFFNNIPYSKEEIKLINVLIWFSLCGYVIEDYSSILLSFYNGVKLYGELSNS